MISCLLLLKHQWDCDTRFSHYTHLLDCQTLPERIAQSMFPMSSFVKSSLAD